MSAPFRELFLELPRAVFEALQAIGEAAVAQADKPSPPARRPWWSSERVWRMLAERWGVAFIEIRRRADDDSVDITFRRRCGHPGVGNINERTLITERLPDAINALDGAFECAERTCCCMEPSP